MKIPFNLELLNCVYVLHGGPGWARIKSAESAYSIELPDSVPRIYFNNVSVFQLYKVLVECIWLTHFFKEYLWMSVEVEKFLLSLMRFLQGSGVWVQRLVASNIHNCISFSFFCSVIWLEFNFFIVCIRVTMLSTRYSLLCEADDWWDYTTGCHIGNRCYF